MNWLLLLHQIPPKPPYFRAKILRRLAQVGALPVKNSAYLLPNTDETREDFEWICREITTEGGAAWLFEADALVGFSSEQLQDSFRRLRDADYEQLIEELPEMEEAKLTHRFAELKKIDFFENEARARVEALIAERQERARTSAPPTASAPQGGIWVTRRGIKVDRIASAWLIQRFIDPQARFRFVETSDYRHAEPELRFDMYEGEFTHEGELCTFEVLVARHGLLPQHPALQPIAEMVHDIDLKDGRYQHPETSGLARMLDGLCLRTADDQQRLQQGARIFDALYESFGA
ncbi:MAG: chromate resistance protein ChrB domain-containing protein [Bryobacteraceae bacterium]